MRKRSSKKWIIMVSVVGVVLVGTGLFFGAKAIYNSGVNDGKRIESEESAERIHALGQAMREKANFQEKVTAVFNELSDEINSEDIDKYIENLGQLITQTANEDVKAILNEYLAKWQEFKEKYASEDNNKITESFNALKTTASEAAAKINDKYNEAIKAAIQDL